MAHELRLYLKPQHNAQVSGGKAALVARVLCYVRDAQQILEPEDNDATGDSVLQSSDSEDPDDSKDDAQSDSSDMGDFIEQLRVTLCPRHCRIRYNTKQVKDSGKFTIFVGGGWEG